MENEVTRRAAEIAREAGELVKALERKRGLDVRGKGSGFDFVTEADFSSQALIKRRVKEYFPLDRVIGEEDNLPDEEVVRRILGERGHRLWLVDPLDGTVNYVRGLGNYGVSVAVFEKGEVVSGAICIPLADELYVAEKGAGAYKNGARIRASDRADVAKAIGGTGVCVIDELRERTTRWNRAVALCGRGQNLRLFGAAVRTQTLVAEGALDYYYEIGPHPWDVGAGALIISEAGGKVTRLDGGPFLYGFGGVLMAAEAVHEPVRNLLLEADAPMGLQFVGTGREPEIIDREET